MVSGYKTGRPVKLLLMICPYVKDLFRHILDDFGDKDLGLETLGIELEIDIRPHKNSLIREMFSKLIIDDEKLLLAGIEKIQEKIALLGIDETKVCSEMIKDFANENLQNILALLANSPLKGSIFFTTASEQLTNRFKANDYSLEKIKEALIKLIKVRDALPDLYEKVRSIFIGKIETEELDIEQLWALFQVFSAGMAFEDKVFDVVRNKLINSIRKMPASFEQLEIIFERVKELKSESNLKEVAGERLLEKVKTDELSIEQTKAVLDKFRASEGILNNFVQSVNEKLRDRVLAAKLDFNWLVTIKEITLDFFKGSKDGHVFIAPDIPEKKKSGALSYIDKEARVLPEEIVLIYDNTIMGGADEGLVITTKGLFWKNAFSASKQASWQEIKRVSYDGEVSKNLFVDEAEITLTLSDDKSKTFQALYLSLKKIARIAKSIPVELNLESFRINLNDFIERTSKKLDVQEYIKDLEEIIPEKISIGNSLIEEETRPGNHSYDANGACQYCRVPHEIAQILKVKCRQENENKSIETQIEDFQVADQNSLTVGSHIVVARASNKDIQHGIWITQECVVTFFCDNIKVKISDDETVCSDTSIVKVTFEEFARGAEVKKIPHENSVPLQVVKRCFSVLGVDGKKTFSTSKDFSLWCINGYKSPEIERFHALEDEEDIIWLLGQKTVYKIEGAEIEWKDVQQLQFGSLLYLQSPYSSPLGNQFKHVRQLKSEEIEKMNIDKELAVFLYFEKNPNAPEWILSHNSIKILDTQESILFSDIQSIEHDNNALLINTKSSCIHLPAKFLDLSSIASFLNAYIAMKNFDISKLQWNWAAKQKILTEMIIGGSICLVATAIFPIFLFLTIFFIIGAIIELRGKKNKDLQKAIGMFKISQNQTIQSSLASTDLAQSTPCMNQQFFLKPSSDKNGLENALGAVKRLLFYFFIFAAPYIFAWFTLLGGTKTEKILAFSWMGIVIVGLSLPSNQGGAVLLFGMLAMVIALVYLSTRKVAERVKE